MEKTGGSTLDWLWHEAKRLGAPIVLTASGQFIAVNYDDEFICEPVHDFMVGA